VGRLVTRLVVLAGASALFAAHAGSAAADVRFHGRSSQERSVVVVAEDDGVPKRVRIRWTADCRRPGFRVIETTVFRRPFDLSTRRRLRDGPPPSYRLRDPGGLRLTVKPRIGGRKTGPRRWAGRFRAVMVVRRGGSVIDRCAVRGVRWRVRR
jgi:hypothetical protein